MRGACLRSRCSQLAWSANVRRRVGLLVSPLCGSFSSISSEQEDECSMSGSDRDVSTDVDDAAARSALRPAQPPLPRALLRGTRLARRGTRHTRAARTRPTNEGGRGMRQLKELATVISLALLLGATAHAADAPSATLELSGGSVGAGVGIDWGVAPSATTRRSTPSR